MCIGPTGIHACMMQFVISLDVERVEISKGFIQLLHLSVINKSKCLPPQARVAGSVPGHDSL